MYANVPITDIYMNVLGKLSVNEKLDLISKLTDSILHATAHKQAKAPTDPFRCFKGEWGEGMSANDYSEQLRASHTFNREAEVW